jgi:hypothetical protein
VICRWQLCAVGNIPFVSNLQLSEREMLEITARLEDKWVRTARRAFGFPEVSSRATRWMIMREFCLSTRLLAELLKGGTKIAHGLADVDQPKTDEF